MHWPVRTTNLDGPRCLHTPGALRCGYRTTIAMARMVLHGRRWEPVNTGPGLQSIARLCGHRAVQCVAGAPLAGMVGSRTAWRLGEPPVHDELRADGCSEIPALSGEDDEAGFEVACPLLSLTGLFVDVEDAILVGGPRCADRFWS